MIDQFVPPSATPPTPLDATSSSSSSPMNLMNSPSVQNRTSTVQVTPEAALQIENDALKKEIGQLKERLQKTEELINFLAHEGKQI